MKMIFIISISSTDNRALLKRHKEIDSTPGTFEEIQSAIELLLGGLN